MNQIEIDYLRRRAGEEEAAAVACADPTAAKIHRNLAALYIRKIDEFSHKLALDASDQVSTKSR